MAEQVTLKAIGASAEPKSFEMVLPAGKKLVDATAIVLPALPEDAATKTYVAKAVNGVIGWVVEE